MSDSLCIHTSCMQRLQILGTLLMQTQANTLAELAKPPDQTTKVLPLNNVLQH